MTSKCWTQFRLSLETLEPRELLSIAADEQFFVYLLNRARSNPAAYGQEVGLPANLLAGVAAQPPLAVNERLGNSSEFKANEMAVNNYFAHTSAVTGDQPNKLARDQGYQLPSFYPTAANNIESLSAGLTRADEVLRQLIEDENITPPGHRIHLLAMDDFWRTHREIGPGHAFSAASTFKEYWAIHTGLVNESDQFLTGVVFADGNGNGRYDLNEGLPAVTVTVGNQSVQTNAGGGWSAQVAANTTVTVTASGGAFGGTATGTFSTLARNREVDFLSGQAAPLVDFAALPVASVLQFSGSAFVVGEGSASTSTITVVRTGSTEGAVSVAYATSAGSAQAGVDYTQTSGTLNFANGEASKTFTVSILNDALLEDDETINLSLTNPSAGALLGNPNAAVLSLWDDDGAGRFQFDSAVLSTREDQPTLQVTVSRILGSLNAAAVEYVLGPFGSLPTRDRATAGQDFQVVLPGTLSFAAGETSKTITIGVAEDTLVESDAESFFLRLQNPTGGAKPGINVDLRINIQDNDLPSVPDMTPNLNRLQLAANGFGKSEEHYRDFVTKAYARFLGRQPDEDGFRYWVTLMQLYETSNHTQGLRQENIEAGFLDSDEYKGRYGGVGENWIKGIYNDLLGRPGDQGGIDYWMGQLAAGVPPAQVALGFTTSLERLRNRVIDTYRTLLEREPDTAGLNYWVAIFQAGGTTEDIVSGFVGSIEYYTKTNRGANNPARWVRASYADVLFRPAAVAEFTYWLNFLKG